MNSSSQYLVRRTDERLGEINWPEPVAVSASAVGGEDCVIACAGFEERSVSVLGRIVERGSRGFALAIVKYLPAYRQNRLAQIRDVARTAEARAEEYTYDRREPSGIGEQLLEFCRHSRRIFVDVSGMSRLLIVQTLVALMGRDQGIDRPVTVLYGEADNYIPSREEFEVSHSSAPSARSESYVSSGVIEIASTPELGSVSMLGESIRLIAFPSFDPSQLNNLVNELQPTYVDVIHGSPPSPDNQWRRRAIRELNLSVLESVQKRFEHTTSTLDYRDTLRLLLRVYAERSMFDRFVIAPTGSKMQAVSVSLFRSALNDVQIVYPTPQVFTTPETHSVGMRCMYEIDFEVAGGSL